MALPGRVHRKPINAIVTGAYGGIGLGVARMLALKGANLLLVGRNEQSLANARASLLSEQDAKHMPRTIRFLCGNVADPETWTALRDFVWVKENPPNVLVNAAGITMKSLLLKSERLDWEQVIRTNLDGTTMACKTVGDLMMRANMKAKRASGRGQDGEGEATPRSPCIINFSSILAHRGGRGSAVYAASKAGILGENQTRIVSFRRLT